MYKTMIMISCMTGMLLCEMKLQVKHGYTQEQQQISSEAEVADFCI